MLTKREVVVIKGSDICATITNDEIEHNRDDKELHNFKTIVALEKDQTPL